MSDQVPIEFDSLAPIEVPENECVIGFRGGEYYTVPELGLPKEYFYEAMELMIKERPDMCFRVVTDDIPLASQFFPQVPISHEIGHDWRSMRYAKYAIISNSSFYILPRILHHHENDDFYGHPNPVTVAPRFWARRNTKEWSTPANYYRQFRYI